MVGFALVVGVVGLEARKRARGGSGPGEGDLIAQGVDVPGCTYSHVEPDGSLVVTDAVQQALLVPADVQAIPVAEVQALTTALATAVSVQVATAQLGDAEAQTL